MVTFHWTADRNGGTPEGFHFLLDGVTMIIGWAPQPVDAPAGSRNSYLDSARDNGNGNSACWTTRSFRVPYLIYAPVIHQNIRQSLLGVSRNSQQAFCVDLPPTCYLRMEGKNIK
jgi:hypothetical protein